MHKRRIVPKKFPPVPSTPNTELSPEEAQQLDYEICWCIEELENLMTKKTNDKQKRETEMCLNILRNPGSSLIQKRQVMRQQFGDYRKKISESDKQKKGQTKSAVNVDNIVPSTSAVFIRKHEPLKEVKANLDSDSFHFKPSDNSFKFNF